MGSILHRLGRNNEARISYEKAISLKSDFLNAYFNLGLVYQNLQSYKKAIKSYEKYPKHPNVSEQLMTIKKDKEESHTDKKKIT